MDEPAAGGIRVGDQAGIGIVLRTRRCVAMKLVGRLDGGNRSQQLDGGWRASLARTVVHDGHRRLDAPHQDRIVRDIQTMMRHLVQVDGAEGILGANERILDVPGEVAAIEEVTLTEPEADGQALALSEWSTPISSP